MHDLKETFQGAEVCGLCFLLTVGATTTTSRWIKLVTDGYKVRNTHSVLLENVEPTVILLTESPSADCGSIIKSLDFVRYSQQTKVRFMSF